MIRRLGLGLLGLVTAWLVTDALHPLTLSAQQPVERFRVMVPEIQGMAGADKKFGERLADQLRDLINEMDTHQPVEERDLKRSLDEYDLDMEDLDCVRARQLAGLMDVPVVFCGSYSPEGEGYRLDTRFIDSGGVEFPVEPFTVPEKGQKEAAERIYQALQVQSDQARASRFCAEYASSQNWAEAENTCKRALELNPGATNSRYTLGVVYQKTGRIQEALAEFQAVLETDAFNTDAMQWAGNLSATLGMDEQAREYYQAFLRLDPENAAVRMKVAYDLAQAGDPLGAMQIIEEGLAKDPENVNLLEQHGGFAFAAGSKARQGQEDLPQEAVDLFRKALDSYHRAYEVEGAEMDVTLLTNMIKAYINLGDYDQAVDFSERILETHGDEAVIWSFYADALQRSDRIEDALAALDRVLELDPQYENVGVRQGRWLLEGGRLEEAMPRFKEAIGRGEQTGDAVCNILFNNGYQRGIQPENWGHAIRVFRLGKEFEISDNVRQKVDFFLGYALLKDAVIRQEPRTKETAQATLPLFQEAQRLLQSAAGYARSQGTLEEDRLALLDNLATFIEIQEAIIKRGL